MAELELERQAHSAELQRLEAENCSVEQERESSVEKLTHQIDQLRAANDSLREQSSSSLSEVDLEKKLADLETANEGLKRKNMETEARKNLRYVLEQNLQSGPFF